MDNREAKFILSAYRPGGQDASDSRLSEALEQARRDPMLEGWFRDSIAFDAAMTEKVRGIDVPSDLRENILAGVKVSRVPHWKNRLRKWTIAAALILGATLGSLIWHSARPGHLAGWQNAALGVTSGNSRALMRNRTTRASFSPGCARTMRRPRKNCQIISLNCQVSAAKHSCGMGIRSR